MLNTSVSHADHKYEVLHGSSMSKRACSNKREELTHTREHTHEMVKHDYDEDSMLETVETDETAES